MSGRNRNLKLRLHEEDPRCHWCKKVTTLTNLPAIKGNADPLMATIDHLVSRYHPERWVTRETTKVLACYECNAKRAKDETASLPRAELFRRGKGFSLNPKGKPIFVETLSSVEEVLDRMKENGIVPIIQDTDMLSDEILQLDGKEVDIIVPIRGSASISYRGSVSTFTKDGDVSGAVFTAATGMPSIVFYGCDVAELTEGEQVPVVRLRS